MMNEKNKSRTNKDTEKSIDPMIFGKVDWTTEKKEELRSLCLSSMNIEQIAEYFNCTEEEILQQVERTNLFWTCNLPWIVYFSIPSTRELLPAICPLLVTQGSRPVLC